MSDEIRDTLRETLGEMRAQESTPEPVIHGVGGGADGQGATSDASGTGDVGPSDVAGTAQSESADGTSAPTGRARDASGKFVKGEVTKTEGPKPQKRDATQAPAQGQPTEVKPPQVGQPSVTTPPKYKAPQSWKATLREKWGVIPEDIQAEVDRREREIASALNETAEPKKFYEQFKQTVSPFEAMIRAEGRQPLQVVGEALQFAAALRTAPPGHKAALVAGLVKTFGIPIDQLDAALSGESVQPSHQNQPLDPAQLRQQIKQELMQDLASQRTQTYQQKASAEVESFAQGKEFFDDLRHDIRAILMSASERGVEMTLENAYNRALLMHKADEKSDIGDVLRQREAAERAKANQVSTQQARVAASSVKPQPASVNGASVADGSVRDTLRETLAELRRAR
jgi:hypothetical protein